MKKRILFSLILLHISFASFSGSWSVKAPIPTTPRYVPAAFSIGTKGYVGCGMAGTTSNMFNDFWQWDQTTNTWTQKANFAGTKREGAIAFSIGNKGYMGAGADISSNTSDFYEYDPALNSWTAKANVPLQGTFCAAAFSIGSKGYVGTGSNGGTMYNDFYEYDPVTDTWTAKATFPGSAREFAVGFSIGTKGYIGLGMFSMGSGKDLWEWDQATDTWTQKTDFPPGTRTFASAFTIGNMGYVGTGLDSTGKGHNDLWQFDPALNSWTQLANFPGQIRYGATAFSIGCSGYFTLGLNLSTVIYQKDLVQYTVCSVPTAKFTANTTKVCAGTTVDFTDQSINTPSTWSWTFIGGTASSSTSQNPSITYNTAGTYEVKLTVTNPGGSNTKDSIAYINVVAPTIPNAGKDTSICVGSSVSLSASGGTTYSWSPATGLSNTAVFNPVASPTVTTKYVLTTSNAPCPAATDTILVTVDSLPLADAGLPASICKGSSTTLSAAGVGPYSWSPMADLNCKNCADPVATPSTSTTYTLTVGTGACSAKDSVSITVNNGPTLNLSNDTTINKGASITLAANGTGTSYLWTPGTGLSCDTCTSINITPTASITYAVLTRDANGCTTTDVITVSLESECGTTFVPTAFSPNGDGQNDVEYVRGNCISELYFLIYDRWGELMFESKNPKDGWDGTYKGKQMDTGVFMYYMKATLLNGEEVSQKGNVTLLR